MLDGELAGAMSRDELTLDYLFEECCVHVLGQLDRLPQLLRYLYSVERRSVCSTASSALRHHLHSRHFGSPLLGLLDETDHAHKDLRMRFYTRAPPIGRKPTAHAHVLQNCAGKCRANITT